jgi:SpoVK/Ycf46/Vps4 family AAA+-type ATPase
MEKTQINDDKKEQVNTAGEQVCKSCRQKNRLSAKYCKYCGEQLEPGKIKTTSDKYTQFELSELIGLDKIKNDLKALINRVKINNERILKGLPHDKFNLHSVFIGNTGTGKTIVAQILYDTYKEIGIIKQGKFVEVKANKFILNPDSYIKESSNGVIFIDEIHKNTDSIDVAVNIIEKKNTETIFILSGLKDDIEKFRINHPDLFQRFENIYIFGDYSQDELFRIAVLNLEKQKYNITEKASLKLKDLLNIMANSALSKYQNAWLVLRDILPKIKNNQSSRLANLDLNYENLLSVIEEEDIPSEFLKRKTTAEVLQTLDAFVGMESIKKSIKRLSESMRMQNENPVEGMKAVRKTVHIVLTGNPGTGKTSIARTLGDLFHSMGFLPTNNVIEVDRSKLVAGYSGQTAILVQQQCDAAKGGILFIDEAYTLAGKEDGFIDSFGSEAIDTLLKRMEDDRGNFVVIAAGYQKNMERFLSSNPGFNSRFTYKFHIDDYTPEELAEIFKKIVQSSGYELHPDSAAKLEKTAKDIYEKRGLDFANGRTMRKLFEDTIECQLIRLSVLPDKKPNVNELKLILPEDIPYSLEEKKDSVQIFEELNALIGVNNVKDEVKNIFEFIQTQNGREKATGKKSSLSLHFILTGNPGTGKTTVARIMGKLFNNIGLLPTDKVVEIAGKDLLGQYVGHTAKKVNEIIDRAIGGILFLDEAYTLTSGSGAADSFSQEAIDKLMKRMEDDRGRFVLMAAGYKKEMDRFLEANPGLPSRFNKTIHFNDFMPAELVEIYKFFAEKEGYRLTPEAIEVLNDNCNNIYNNRDTNFGNARDIRNYFDRSLQRQATRLSKNISGERKTADDYSALIPEDVIETVGNMKSSTESDAIEKLNKLIGLQNVKNQISDLVSYLKVEKQRAAGGGIETALNLHMVFYGNPGTGKTTVARILCDVFKSIGLLKKGQLVEVDRAGLVGQYVGETAQKTQKVINESLGGVLFIDEAYALMPRNMSADYGKEAIDILLKNMEDHKGEFIVIAAGYRNEMAGFINSNPGLQSRFTRFIDFEDYNPDELFRIYTFMAGSKGLTYPELFETTLRSLCEKIYTERDHNFANGRTIRNIFEKTLQNQARRIAPLLNNNPDPRELNRLEPEDLKGTL